MNKREKLEKRLNDLNLKIQLGLSVIASHRLPVPYSIKDEAVINQLKDVKDRLEKSATEDLRGWVEERKEVKKELEGMG